MFNSITKEKVQLLRDHFSRRQNEVLAFTRSLVETESPSGDAEGSDKVVSLLAASARSIAAIDSVDRIVSENFGVHLRIRAFGSGMSRIPPLVIIGHTDTVHPRGSLAARPWRAEGGRISGPGIFDMKANCALVLEA